MKNKHKSILLSVTLGNDKYLNNSILFKDGSLLEFTTDNNDNFEDPLDVFYQQIERLPVEEKLRLSIPSKYNNHFSCYKISHYYKGKKQFKKMDLRIYLATYFYGSNLPNPNFMFILTNYKEEQHKDYLYQYLESFFKELLGNERYKNTKIQLEWEPYDE